MQCRGIGPHLSARGNFHGFSRVTTRTWGTFSSYSSGIHEQFLFFQRCQDSSLVKMDTSGVKTTLGRTIRTLLDVRQETEVHFLVGTVILGFLSIFKKGQASSPYEALNSVCLWSCQRDVSPPVQMRRTPMALSRVSTEDSDMPSSCEKKDEPEFKPLQGSHAFF